MVNLFQIAAKIRILPKLDKKHPLLLCVPTSMNCAKTTSMNRIFRLSTLEKEAPIMIQNSFM